MHHREVNGIEDPTDQDATPDKGAATEQDATGGQDAATEQDATGGQDAATEQDADLIELTTPVGRDWEPVVRIVLGGIADRLDLGFDELDDLQLAVERLLTEGDPRSPVTLSFELLPGGVRTRVGPLRSAALADALQGPDPQPGELTLPRILSTVVDSYGVEKVADGHLVVRLEKSVRGR